MNWIFTGGQRGNDFRTFQCTVLRTCVRMSLQVKFRSRGAMIKPFQHLSEQQSDNKSIGRRCVSGEKCRRSRAPSRSSPAGGSESAETRRTYRESQGGANLGYPGQNLNNERLSPFSSTINVTGICCAFAVSRSHKGVSDKPWYSKLSETDWPNSKFGVMHACGAYTCIVDAKMYSTGRPIEPDDDISLC